MYLVPPYAAHVAPSARRAPCHAARLRALRLVALATVALLAALAMPMSASAQSAPNLFPAGSSPLGRTFGAWSAEWWKQAYATHTGPGTPFADGAVRCTQLGVGNVVFLVGTTSGTASRTCDVPRGRALFLPLVNAECSQAIDGAQTYAARLACARGLIDQVDPSSLLLRIGIHGGPGVRIPPAVLAAFRVDSPPFVWSSVADNPFGVPAVTDNPSAANGYYVALPPLPAGRWDLTFGGAAPALGFSTTASYVLTVR